MSQQELIQFIEELIQYTKELYQFSLAEISSEQPEYFDDIDKDKLLDLVAQPEFLFIFKIIIPSFLFYGEHPAKLYRKARQGDVESLDKILRLDKGAVCCKRINKHFYSPTDSCELKKLTLALHRQPKGKISYQKAKFLIAGFISFLSEILGHRLSAPEIQDLFNAYAVDSGYDDLIDADLPPSPEGFAKAIQRERSFWSSFLKPDKK